LSFSQFDLKKRFGSVVLLAASRLKQFHQVPRRIAQKNLRADPVRSRCRCGTARQQSCDLAWKIIRNKMDAVPAASFGGERHQASAARLSWSVRLAIAAATQALRLRTQVRSLIEQ
jgi:hypothetical protein